MLVTSGGQQDECILVITPDAVVRHLTAAVIDRVIDAGFIPAYHRLLWTPPPEIDVFHRRHATVAADPRLFRLAEMLFDLGPALVVVLKHRTATSHAMFSLMRELKGRGEPAHASPGSIRHDLGAINTTLNIVHATESAEEVERDAAVFLGDTRPRDQDPIDELARTVSMLERVQPLESRLFDHVLGEYRRKVLAAMWNSLAPRNRLAVAGWLERDVDWLAVAPLGEWLGQSCPLSRLLHIEFRPGSTESWDEISATLAEHGVVLDRWAELILASSLKFQSQRAEPKVRVSIGGQ